MKTSELIEQARKCASRECGNCSKNCDDCEKNPCYSCPFENDDVVSCSDKLINALADRLESAYEDIYINCSTCIHYPCNHRADCFNNEYKGWKWSGDAE